MTSIAVLMFAWLALRHVGESAFLEDQVDQLQNFESLLRFQPEGLWGAIMSGTAPPARALGPLGAIVFGVPVSLGLGVDAIHVVTSLLIALTTALCFRALTRVDAMLAWLWLLVFSASALVWWNTALLWSNTVLLSIGLVFATLAIACLRQPDRTTLAWLFVTVLVGLQLHLVAVVALPIAAIVGAATCRSARPIDARAHRWALCVCVLLVLTPYVIAEGLSGFANTRAIVGHLGSSSAGRVPDAGSATASLAVAWDPTRLLEALGLGWAPVTLIGTALAVAALMLTRTGPAFWLTLCAVVGIAGQALFFLWMSRPFAGYHHVTMLAPFYAIVPAVLIRRLVFPPAVSMRAACAAGAMVSVLLIVAGPSLADRSAERTPWSYSRIRATLDALCGSAAVDTDEGPAFAAQLNPRYDSVLRYLMKRGLTTCRYQPSSDVVIAAARDGRHPAAKTIGEATFYRELVLPPGLARYRRAP